jgi:hypothetical protein
VLAAVDLKYISIECESHDKSVATIDCSVGGRFASISANFIKPQSKLMV